MSLFRKPAAGSRQPGSGLANLNETARQLPTVAGLSRAGIHRAGLMEDLDRYYAIQRSAEQLDMQRSGMQAQLKQQDREFGLRERGVAAQEQRAVAAQEQRIAPQSGGGRVSQGLGGDAQPSAMSELREPKIGDREKMDAQWQQQTALTLDKDMSEMLKAARAIDYTPEGRRAYAQLAAEGRAIQASKARHRPAQWSQMAGQFMERFERADLGSYQNEPPNIRDAMARQYQDMGNGVGLLMDNNGNLRPFNSVAGKDMAAIAPLQEDGQPKPVRADERFLELYGGTKNAPAFNKAKREAISDIQTEWSMKPGNEGDTPPMPSPEEIEERILRDIEYQVQMENRLRGIKAPGAEAAPAEAASRGLGMPAMAPEAASRGPGADFRDRIRAENEDRSNREKPIPWYFRESEEGKATTRAMQLAQTPEEAAQIAQQFVQTGIERVAGMPEAAKLQERMALRGISGAWTKYVSEEAVAIQVEAGSKDPFADILKHAEAMLSLPEGFSIENAPLEWQEKLKGEMASVHTQAEYDKLPVGEIFIDGVTGKMVRKPVKGAPAGNVQWKKGLMEGIR